MTLESQSSSLLWDSSNSPLQFRTSSQSNLPNYYDCSLVTPVRLTERKRQSQATVLHIPPVKLRSTMTWHSSEDDRLPTHTPLIMATDKEMSLFKQKFDRLRATLSQSLEDNRHTFDKMHYKKTSIQQNLDEHDRLIDELLVNSIEMNQRIHKLKTDILKQRQRRDREEMKQLKLQRSIARLSQRKDQPNENIQQNETQKLIDQFNKRILELRNEQKKELVGRDEQIEQLKEELYDQFYYESDEYLKLLRAGERAYDLESQKRDVLKEVIDDYETNIYRARKPCCISTMHRLCKVSTQLRLYLVLEIAIHELFHSSCSCGPFRRSYETFLRLHPN